MIRNVREFDHPYVKRGYATNSTSLTKNGWSDWVTKRIDAIVKPEANSCWLSCQLQCIGGRQSRFRTQANNGTSFSWRDSTVFATLDCFHKGESKTVAEDWAKVNDAEGIGANGKFSTTDRRVLWASYGEFELDKVWDKYHDSREKYDKLAMVRRRMDSDGTFTPNAFCVKRADASVSSATASG